MASFNIFVSEQGSDMLNVYDHVKDAFGYESYLDVLPPDLRNGLVRMRVSSHSLRVQTGRYGANRIPRNERRCIYCDMNDIDDELHFLCKCPCFDDLRRTYIKRYFYTRTNMYKLIELLKCDDRSTLVKLCKFIKLAFNRRNAIVNRG